MNARTRRPASAWASVVVLALALVAWVASRPDDAPDAAAPDGGSPAATLDADDGAQAVEEAFRGRASGESVRVRGRVRSVLPDDRDGSRHQRFVLELSSGRTLLIAHNIDLAPRVPLEVGEEVELAGDYEWNNRGGVVHWTHHDPDEERPGGWIRHRGQLYQ